VNVVSLPQSMTLAQFAQKYPSAVDVTELAIVNQIENPNAPIPAGTAVKQVVAGRSPKG